MPPSEMLKRIRFIHTIVYGSQIGTADEIRDSVAEFS